MTGRFHNATLFSLLIQSRYKVSKLIELFCVRELANQLGKSTKEGRIIMSVINPGFVATNLMREKGFVYNLWFQPSKKIMSRTAEEGGRTLVHAAEGGEETNGHYLDDCKIGR
jgi:retinol dehydrogenase-12